MISAIKVGVLLLLIEVTCGAKQQPSKPLNQPLAPCQLCRTLVNSFMFWMEKHNADGGIEKAESTEQNRTNSKLRLEEIGSKLCSEVAVGKDQCYELSNTIQKAVREWWDSYREDGHDLHSWLCINRLSACCPENHYGRDCRPCEGVPNNVCSDHGKCKGSGTRKGNGDCICEAGYSGKFCETCAKGFYEAFRGEGKFLCSACHRSCKGGCKAAGPKQCVRCANGWANDEELGCIDVNECITVDTPCKFSEFCVNSEGSYMCIACDKSCSGCFGDGPDMCEKCAPGFVLKNKMCIDESAGDKNRYISTTRYLTYFGLCLATCIIFQKNVAIASVIGLAVAVYVSASEYLLMTSTNI